jgi:hypothetical protein
MELRSGAGWPRNCSGDAFMKALDTFKSWVGEFIELALMLISVGVLVQILFGKDVMFFSNITENLMAFITGLGNGGFVGLIALLVIVSVFNRRTTNGTATPKT